MSYLPLPYTTLKGTTPGSTSGESVELTPFWPTPGLLNNRSATLEMRVVAAGFAYGSATLTLQSFVQRFTIKRSSGVTTITGQDTQHQFGDSGGSSWTVTASVGTSPDRFSIVFTTGSTTYSVNVTADVYFTFSGATVPAPTPLVEWRTDHALSLAAGNNTWNSRVPSNTYELLSIDSHDLTLTSSWQNGQNGVGYPHHNAGYAVSGGRDCFLSQTNPPLSGNDLTVYLVMDFHTFGNPPGPASTGPISIFQIGERNQLSGNWPQFQIAIDNSSSYISLFDRDTPGVAGEYAHGFSVPAIGNSPYLIGPTLVVCQTQRNSGHNVIFGGVQLSPIVINIAGTVPALTTDVMMVCGDEYYNSGGTKLTDECGCTLGNILIYNAYHNSTTISAVSSALNTYWGL
jgi:hypothetical protein